MTRIQCIPARLDQYVNHNPRLIFKAGLVFRARPLLAQLRQTPGLYLRPELYLRPGFYSRKYGTYSPGTDMGWKVGYWWPRDVSQWEATQTGAELKRWSPAPLCIASCWLTSLSCKPCYTTYALLCELQYQYQTWIYTAHSCNLLPSVLGRCWLGGRKGIWPVNTEW